MAIALGLAILGAVLLVGTVSATVRHSRIPVYRPTATLGAQECKPESAGGHPLPKRNSGPLTTVEIYTVLASVDPHVRRDPHSGPPRSPYYNNETEWSYYRAHGPTNPAGNPGPPCRWRGGFKREVVGPYPFSGKVTMRLRVVKETRHYIGGYGFHGDANDDVIKVLHDHEYVILAPHRH